MGETQVNILGRAENEQTIEDTATVQDRVCTAHAPKWAHWPLLALGGLGIALTGYLSWTAFTGGPVQGCSAGGGCDIVLTSRWATLLGLPTAFGGCWPTPGSQPSRSSAEQTGTGLMPGPLPYSASATAST